MKYFINYKDEFSSKILLALVIFLVVWTRTLSSADYLSVGSSQYSHVTPSLSVNHERSHNSVMQEKECCVARLCGYKIQGNFSCKVSKYVISNGPQRSLPKWLWFDEENKTLKGIPSPADEGINEILIIGLRQHQNDPVGYICGLLTVKIVVSSLKDFPTSPIINNRFSKPSISQGLICQFNEPIVLASLVVAGNFHEMDGKEKINVLGSLLQDYHISIYDVFVLSNSDDSLKGLLQSSHVLASGPGANRSASGLSTTITWHVKCGVIHLDDSLFEVMEKLSKQLTFINNVSYAPIGWHVVTGFKKHHVRRRRNVVGTTTPAFSTIPISQATVITTKIKVTRTTHVIQTKMFTWSRPLPTFSSPYTVNKTSLLFQSSTISSRFNNTTFASQYNSASSISPVVTSLSNTMSSSQIISPSEQKTTHISQYMSVSPTLILSPGTIFSLSHISSRQTSEISHSDRVNSTFPVMSPSRNKSAMFQISSSKQERSSNSIKTSSQIHRTSTVTRYDSLSSTTSQLPSSKRRTLVQSSLTRSEKQRSTNVIVPSNRSSTSPTVQTVINNASLSSTVFHYVSGITSPVISILLTTEHFSSNVSNVSSTKAMTTAIRPNNSTTSLLQSSFSNFIDTSSLSSSRVYSSVLHITTSGTINETKSAKVNQTTFESSTGHIRSILLTTTLATNISVTTPISYTISPSYTPITSSRSSVPTPSFLSYTTTLYEASVSTSERILGSSHTTGTLVLSSRSVTRQTSDMDKTAESTSPLFTSGIISKSLQSSDYVNSKITKTLTTNSTLYSSRVDASSNDTMPPSSNSAMSSQLTSGSAVRSKLTSISVMKPTSTEKTFHIVTSQSSSEYKSILSPIPSTAHFTTATENTPTEQMKSTYSSLIQTTPVSIYTSFQTKTISSQPSISSDLSTGWSMSYTSAKLSSRTSWFARPSYTSRQSPQTTTVLTPTSMMMPVTASSSELSPSSVSSQSSSVIPTVPSKGSPKVYNSFDLLHVTFGKVFSVQIPVDTFYDREDGNTRNLRLECLTEAHSSLSKNSWLQFNATTQTLYGLILKSQTENISSEYFLTASDRDGNTVFDAFTVSIDKSSKPLAAMFSVKLTGISLGVFNRDINNILSIVRAIAGYYGDKDESMIHVLTLTEGSVIFTWSNTSLQTCDEDLINDIASKLITKQGNIQPDFYNALSQKFIPGNIFVNYTGPCVLHSTENPSVSELSSHDTSPWVKYVLPSLVLAVVIVVIAVAFLLFKRHSGVKILKEDKQIFKRRKPIILDGEQEMSTLSGKPIQIPEDSLTPIRLRRESSFGTPEYDDDISDVPILPAPAYQRLPPMYRDGSTNRYNTPPPPYKMPPSYSC